MHAPASLIRLVLLAVLLLPSGLAQAATLISTNSAWRYFRGTAHPSPAAPAAWRQVTFGDGAWSAGNGAFAYGEPGFNGTALTGMQNVHSTLFLRRKFTVVNPANVSALDLTTVCDDGFVAYLNGQRVASFRAPETDPDHTSLATAAEEYVWNIQSIANPAAILIPGENVLAVVVLNGSLGSSDLVFDAELVATEKTPEPPRIAAVLPPPGLLTNLNSITVTFSEPVTGVSAPHFLVNGIPATGISGSGSTYTFTFARPAFGGVQISWGSLHQITDLDAQRFDGGAPGAVWNYELLDAAGPAVIQRLPPPGLAVRQLAAVELTFNRSVAGLDATDLRLNGVAATAVTGAGPGPYRFLFPPAANGTAAFTWAPDHGIASDEPEPHPFVAAGWSCAVDSGRPVPPVIINELLADNGAGAADEDGDTEDWIELQNRGSVPVNLEGWSLSNDRDEEGQWIFPPVTLPANGFLIVWASGKDRRTVAGGARLHTNFKLNGTGDSLRLFGPELPRQAVSEVRYPEQGTDHSYGRQGADAAAAWRYFSSPTPGSANGTSTITNRVAGVRFSVERGFFDRPFTLSLVTETPGATIRYTTNGAAPTLTTGSLYAGPLTIPASRVIRAAAFAANQLPSTVGTHTYLFNLSASRRLLPALSLVTATNHLYGRTGIMEYSPRNTDKHGSAWERPVSVELIRPQDNGGFQIDAGIRVAGGDYIRSLYNYRSGNLPENKYSYRLYFRGEYGPGRLDYPMFPDTTVSSFNTLHLRAGMNDHSNPLMKDEFVRALAGDVGIVACHGTFVNVFLNGVYRGIYNPAERVDDDFLQRYHGGGDRWDVMGPNNQAIRGDAVAWSQLRSVVRLDLTVRANYENVAARMDLENFVDYLLPHIWADNDDWPHNNTRAAREKVPGAKFRFYPWDAEFAFTGHGVSYDTIATTLSTLSPPWGTTDYQQMFNALKRSPEFRLLFADRVHRAFFNGGPLTDERLRARYEEVKARVAPSISGFNNTISSWINGRRRWVTNSFQRAGFLASSNAPVFNRHGGAVPAGFSLAMTNLAGTIYFTLDGTDPRVPFASTPAPGAQTYTAPLTLGASIRVLARSLAGTNWSALSDARFTVSEAGPTVRISELTYNPPGGDAFEFIELLNTGGLAADLSDHSFTGVTFRFPKPFPPLAAGARLVLASDANPAAFGVRYPAVTVAGWYGGGLNNGGERIALLDRDGRTVTSVTFGDDLPWPEQPDGLGASLELTDPQGDPDDPANWHASQPGDGTPGTANSAAPVPAVRLNEIASAIPPAADWIELHNAGPGSANLAGWSLSDSGEPRRFVFPAGTSLAAGAYLRVFGGSTGAPGSLSTGFGLDRDGGTVALFDAQTNRVDAVTFGPALAGFSLGRTAAGLTLCEPTPGDINEVAPLGDPARLRLNEFVANSDLGDDWFELHNLDTRPVAVRGSLLGTSNALFRVTAPVFVAGGGFATLKADENPGPDHVDFKLTAAGDELVLRSGDGAELDRVTWRNAGLGLATGRLPDGTGAWTALPFSASPGSSNYLSAPGEGLRLNEILARFQPTSDLPTPVLSDWFELRNPTATAVSLTGHSVSVGEPRAGEWGFPAGTSIPANGQLLVLATTNATPGQVNLGRSLRDGGTTLSLFDPRGQLLDTVTFGPQLPNRSVGRTAVGWELLAAATPGFANGAAAPLGSSAGVRLNEWLAEGGTNSEDWLELYNPADLPVNLAGHFLTDDPSLAGITRFPVAPLTFIAAGGYLQFLADGDVQDGPNHVGFQLDAWGETLRLSAPNRVLLDSVAFLPQTLGVSEGRYLDGGSLVVAFPDVASPGAPNRLPATDRDGDGLADAWESLNGFDPSSGSDAGTDPDGDGVSTLEEFLAGTDPRNATSVLRLRLEVAADGAVTLRFPAVAGRTYRVAYAAAASGAVWQTLSEVPAPTADGEITVTDNTPPDQRPARLYRVITPAGN
jgi:hypothetical protein